MKIDNKEIATGNCIVRWNNLAKRFDTISVDALNEEIHDVGNSRPTQFVKNAKDAGTVPVQQATVTCSAKELPNGDIVATYTDVVTGKVVSKQTHKALK